MISTIRIYKQLVELKDEATLAIFVSMDELSDEDRDGLMRILSAATRALNDVRFGKPVGR